jgi:hypothetical protein
MPGLVDLWNGRAFRGDTAQISVDGGTVQIGGLIGTAWQVPLIPVNLTGEIGYRYRRFASLSFTHGSMTVVPSDWPKNLNLSGLHMLLGVGVRMPPKKSSGS